MFESKDLEKANMTSTKKADELEAMLAMAEDISLEENTTDDNILTGKSPKHPDETIRNVRMVSFTEEEEYFEMKSQVEELNAQLDGREKIIADLRRKIKTLEEKVERCVCKNKRRREKSQEKSFQQGRSKSGRMSREGSFQKRNKSLSPIPDEKTTIQPKLKWRPKHTITFKPTSKKIHPAVKRFKEHHVNGRHDPVKRRNDVANFKTGTRVKRLQRAGALRPLAGKNPSETFYVTTDRLDFRSTGSSQKKERGRALFALVGCPL